MHKEIFVNLAVDDLPRSKAFYERLGMTINPQFSNEQGACVVISEHIHVMLLTKGFFKTFTDKALADTGKTVQALLCLSCESRAEVDAVVAKALAAGAKAPRPVQDHGFMYSHGFEDLDGHTWELMYMDMAAAPTQL
ncbi:MAG: VOC family protein [Rhizobacter sp.]